MTATLTEPPASPAAPPKGRNRILPSPVTGQELVLIGVIAVIWVGLALATPAFLTAGSIRPLLVATAPIALIGVGMTIIIITGGIDVSVGGAIMVCSVITAKALVGEVSLVPAVLLSVAVGGVLGLVNGVLIAYGRVHAIIITFGTANLFLFLGLQIFGSSTVNGIPQTFEFFGRGAAGQTLGVPNAFLITAIVTAIAVVVPAAHRRWPALLRHRGRCARRAPGRGEGAAPPSCWPTSSPACWSGSRPASSSRRAPRRSTSPSAAARSSPSSPRSSSAARRSWAAAARCSARSSARCSCSR